MSEELRVAEERTKGSHTPGPWYVEAIMGDDPHEICCDSRENRGTPEVIASVVWDDEDPNPVLGLAEANANARLIASAPELLFALKALVDWQAEIKHAVPLSYLEGAKAAITKAEGKS